MAQIPTSTSTGTDDHKRFLQLLRKFDTAMLVTHTPEGQCHARPMTIADISPTGVLWFATHVPTLKAEEIEKDHRVLVALQSRSKFLSISGQARLSKDPQRIAELWSTGWRLWFTDKNDPNLALIQVVPEEAEYWDRSGAEGIRFMLRAAAAYVTGRQLAGTETDPNHHGKFHM